MTEQKPPTDLDRAAGTTETYKGAKLAEVPADRVPDRPGVTRDGAVLKDEQPAVPPA